MCVVSILVEEYNAFQALPGDVRVYIIVHSAVERETFVLLFCEVYECV